MRIPNSCWATSTRRRTRQNCSWKQSVYSNYSYKQSCLHVSTYLIRKHLQCLMARWYRDCITPSLLIWYFLLLVCACETDTELQVKKHTFLLFCLTNYSCIFVDVVTWCKQLFCVFHTFWAWRILFSWPWTWSWESILLMCFEMTLLVLF